MWVLRESMCAGPVFFWPFRTPQKITQGLHSWGLHAFRRRAVIKVCLYTILSRLEGLFYVTQCIERRLLVTFLRATPPWHFNHLFSCHGGEFSILLVGPRVWGCCFSVGEFASGCRQGVQLTCYPKCDPVTTMPIYNGAQNVLALLLLELVW